MNTWTRTAALLALAVCTFASAPAAVAQDARGPRPGPSGTDFTRSSPFDPPTEDAFVADVGPGLDTGCTFNDDPGHPLRIDVVVDRYVGAVDGDGFLVDPGALVAAGIVPATVNVIMPAFDVDVNGAPPPEQDGVFFNGVRKGALNGDDGIWLLNAFAVDVGKVKFPAAPGGTATNEVRIDVDELSSGRWCTAIDWVALVVPIQVEAAVTMTSTGSPILEVAGGVFWEQTIDPSDPSCPVTDVTTDRDAFPFSGPAGTDVAVEAELALCPGGGPGVEVSAEWRVTGTGLTGTTAFTGTTGTVPVRMPDEVGAYSVEFDYTVDGEAVPTITRKLFVTLAAPLTARLGGAPKRLWYERATDWGAGQDAEGPLLNALLDAEYAYGGANWRYGYSFSPLVAKCTWDQLVDPASGCDYSDCYVFSDVFDRMAAVLGVAGLTPIRVTGQGGQSFVTTGAPSLDPAFPGSARPLAGGPYDKYLFSSHSLRRKGTYYDATFNGRYAAPDQFVLYNLTGGVDPTRTYLETVEGAKVYPLAGTSYDSWGAYAYDATPFTAGLGPTGSSPLGLGLGAASADVTLTGQVGYTPVDLDGDGLFEALDVDVEVEVLADGTYTVYGTLLLDGALVANRSAYDAANPTLAVRTSTAGVETVTLRFSGEQIFESGVDGPYELQLIAADAGGTEVLSVETPDYDYAEFGEIGVAFSDVSESAVDDDEDGRFESIRATVLLDVRRAGDYILEGSVSGAEGGATLSSDGRPVSLDAGPQTVVLEFDGQPIGRSGVDGPYDLTVILYDASGTALRSIEVPTSGYDADAFAVFLDLDGGFGDVGVDDDGDVLFNRLRITFDGTAETAGDYLLSAALSSVGGSAVVYRDTLVTLTGDSQSLVVNVEGSLIRAAQIDGPYEVVLVVRDPVTLEPVDRLRLPTLTGTYVHTDFDTALDAGIALTGTSQDAGVDTDGNGLFDRLDVAVEVDLAAADVYQWSARLVDADGTEIDFDASGGSLGAGTQTLTFSFDGEAIGSNGVDGPYFVRGLLVFGNGGANLVATEVATTQPYTADQFEGSTPAIAVVGPMRDQGVDVDGDDLFDRLVVEVDLALSGASTYQWSAELFDSGGTRIGTSSGNGPLGPGSATVTFEFDGEAIVAGEVDGPYVVRNLVVTGDNGASVSVDPLGETAAYAYTQFDGFSPSLSLTGETDDRGVDSDDDGLFDVLRVEAGIEATAVGQYEWTARLVDATGAEVTTTSGSASFGFGAHTLTFDFDGGAIWAHGVNGPYRVLDLALTGDNGLTLDAAQVAVTGDYAFTQFDPPSVVACAPAVAVAFGDFSTDATAPARGQFVEVENTAPSGPSVDLSGCALVVFDPLSDRVLYVTTPAGTVAPGAPFVFATTDGDQALPPGVLPAGPSAILLVADAVVVGDDQAAVEAGLVAGVVYETAADVLGALAGGATEAERDAFLAVLNGVGVATEGDGPLDLSVAARPNPSRGRLVIAFGMAEAGDARVSLIDMLGRRVVVASEGGRGAGRHEVVLDTSALPAGSYVVRLETGGRAEVARVTVAR